MPRCLAVWALLVALFWAPLAPALSAHEAGMACCRNGKKHACCSRLAKKMGRSTAATISALASCGKSCCQKASLPSATAAALVEQPAPGEILVSVAPLLIAGTGKTSTNPLPLSLYQRPPPSLSILSFA